MFFFLSGIESSGGVMTTVLPRNTPLPAHKVHHFTTNADDQTSVTIKVCLLLKLFVLVEIILKIVHNLKADTPLEASNVFFTGVISLGIGEAEMVKTRCF